LILCVIAALVQHGHRQFREDSAAIELPFLLLLQQPRTHLANDCRVIGGNAYD